MSAARAIVLFAALVACAGPKAPAPPPAAPATPAEAEPPPLRDLPPPLPPPAEPPAAVETPSTREPSDPLELLWNHRLNFAAGGAPLVTIRVSTGPTPEIVFSGLGAIQVKPRGGAAVDAPAGATFTATAHDALPAALARYPLLAELVLRDRRGLEAAEAKWKERGVATRQRLAGSVYGIAGRVIDNRRLLLLADGDGSEAWAQGFAKDAQARFGEQVPLFTEIVTRPSGRIDVREAATGKLVASGDGAVAVSTGGGAGFTLGGRAYRGRLYLALDAAGKLVAVDAVALEDLLRGLVPSEMPASAPAEALEAQAVTARSNVLAQIGTRHLVDPYVLCDEVHCQMYKGESAEVASTDAAVRATRGEALFGAKDRALVDAVYSAVCGGHGEDNDAVWGGVPSDSLRGKPDLPSGEGKAWASLADPAKLERFLASGPRAYCARASRYRWEVRLPQAKLDALAAPLGLPGVESLTVKRRGVSGRAIDVELRGGGKSATVHGELAIRRLLDNLPSSMFVVSRDGADWIFKGGGWGHGAGMCQTGAMGRAGAGQGYRDILKAYYSGAEVVKIY